MERAQYLESEKQGLRSDMTFTGYLVLDKSLSLLKT